MLPRMIIIMILMTAISVASNRLIKGDIGILIIIYRLLTIIFSNQINMII